MESIKELLGHWSMVVTEKAYANFEANHLHADVKVLDNLLDEIHKCCGLKYSSIFYKIFCPQLIQDGINRINGLVS